MKSGSTNMWIEMLLRTIQCMHNTGSNFHSSRLLVRYDTSFVARTCARDARNDDRPGLQIEVSSRANERKFRYCSKTLNKRSASRSHSEAYSFSLPGMMRNESTALQLDRCSRSEVIPETNSSGDLGIWNSNRPCCHM